MPSVRKVQEVRWALELEVVRLAAQRRWTKDLVRMRRHLKERRKALIRKDMAAALDADLSFHCAVAEAADNKVIADLYRTFALALRRALETLWDAMGSNPAETEQLHHQLVEAIAARDVLQAITTTAVLLDRHGKVSSESLPLRAK
jgi:DNA-binding FadR family transcriptional regulator